jgi:hypothetical protein
MLQIITLRLLLDQQMDRVTPLTLCGRHEEVALWYVLFLTTTRFSEFDAPWQPFFMHRIYQLDYNRNTGEYRMLDRFLPQVCVLLVYHSL